MGRRRKNLKRASSKVEEVALQEEQCIMEVVSLRGSDLIEVMDAIGGKSLALFPAKFQKSIWIKRDSEIFKSTVVDDSNVEQQRPIAESNDESDSNEDYGLPPLEANLNRIRPMELYLDFEADQD